jgi:pyrroline-5-carboxylate reductase
MNIRFIGGGNMAAALIGGLLQQGCSREQIVVVETNADQRGRIKREFDVEAAPDLGGKVFDAGGPANTGVIVLAVKPQQLAPVARELAPLLSGQLVVSIAAGIRARDIARWLGGYERLVRAMPNTPALVRAAVTGLYALPDVDTEGKRAAEAILGAVGSVLWCENEEMLDAVTAISGSGPAYIFYFIESVQQAARELGLDPAQARSLSLQTFLGASTLAASSKEEAATLRARVTSPGGTTEQAIKVLEREGVKNAILSAAHAARRRSRELADEFGKA